MTPEAIKTFSTFGVGILCAVLGIVALALFFTELSRLATGGVKPEAMAVRGVLKKDTWATVHMSGSIHSARDSRVAREETMSADNAPRVAVLAGINGAGKTTASREVLLDVHKITTFVNADAIAKGLNGFNPEAEAVRAGRIMIEQLHSLAASRQSFALETTLAARSYASWLAELKVRGYEVHLLYYWLQSAEIAVQRVAGRVRSGGHHVPEETIRRRYPRSV